MRTNFSGVWATFEYLDDTCAAIKELRSAGFSQITTHTPCARHEIDHALGNPQSRVPFATLAGAFVGFCLAVLILTKMALDWILPVSAKPIVSVPIMGPIAFELSVLMAIFFTMGGIVLLILRDTLKHPVPKSRKYKDYDRFMRDRFGIVVACGNEDLEKLENIFKKHLAEEVNLES
jgi:molybdopterin-containing oxidoreductase family membrane subunit